MDKLTRFIDCYIPTEACNLRCHYCYITQKRKFNNKLAHFERSPKYIQKALSKERLGGTCLLNLCAGGETLLSHEVLDITHALLQEGHYLMVVTNGTLSSRFDEIAKWDKDLLSRLFFKFSFHYLEMIKLNLIDTFFENVNKMQSAGCSFTVEVTPSDELIPHIDELKKVCNEKLGALCHLTIARDERTKGMELLSSLSWDEYKKTWSVFDSELFHFKAEIFGKKQTKFCYAGDWSTVLNLKTGELLKCYYSDVLDNIYSDITQPIQFKAIGRSCPLPHCHNGHAFLTLGNIPQLKSPSFASVRNRINQEGVSWLTPQYNDFISQKLYFNNKKYSVSKKIKCSKKILNLKYKIVKIPFVYNLYKKLNDHY